MKINGLDERGSCRWCRGRLGPIINHVTRGRSAIVGCEHCDSPCNRPRCPTCAKITGTVRIIDKPPEP